MTAPSVYDHYSRVDANYAGGIYRVVGTDEDTVTLLRVGDEDGRRVNTGELITVSMDEIDGFERAENPDGNRPLVEFLASAPETAYWSVRVFVDEVVEHPLPTTIALCLLMVGSLGEGALPLPDAVLGALILAGGLGLAYVGSGRL